MIFPEQVVEAAPAKVNLALHVLGRREDGYHELDSLVAFVPEAADIVTVERAPTLSLEVSGPFAGEVPAGGRNLAWRAARALARRWPAAFGEVKITLEKHLPAAGGIGGGSADAAAVIRAMRRLFSPFVSETEMREIALSLGADVPVCLFAGAARMGGIGERITALEMPPLPVLLVNPGVRLSTAKVFAARAAMRTGEPGAGLDLPNPLPSSPADFIAMLQGLRNDLEAAARALAPEVAACLGALRALPGARLARMSGSGATCFALFEEMETARAAAATLQERRPRWWIIVGMLM